MLSLPNKIFFNKGVLSGKTNDSNQYGFHISILSKILSFSIKHIFPIVIFLAIFSTGFIDLPEDNCNKVITGKTESNALKDKINIEMVFVKGGSFEMGNKKDLIINKHYKVKLNGFYIGKYEITQKIWTLVMGNNPSYFKGENLPVEQVSWHEVQIFLKKLNKLTDKKYRLPTEAEWEYAAKGGEKSKNFKFAGSNNVDEVAWYKKNSNKKTHPVGKKKSNELGIFDMSGNVSEWCGDWHSKDFYQGSYLVNPQGPPTGIMKNTRGGFWISYGPSCNISERSGFVAKDAGSAVGFRVALDE